MSKITPCLWFDGRAEEAARLYCGLVPDSQVDQVHRYGQDGPGGRAGEVMMVTFTLAGQSFQALNGGPTYAFTPAVSFSVACEDQAEIDRLWDGLIAQGGAPNQCGWLRDRFGVSWQIIPKQLGQLMGGGAEQGRRVMQALMGMVKLDIAALRAAAEAARAS